VDDKIIYCTNAESNQWTHDTHSCKQNRITITPTHCTYAVTLMIYDHQPLLLHHTHREIALIIQQDKYLLFR